MYTARVNTPWILSIDKEASHVMQNEDDWNNRTDK